MPRYEVFLPAAPPSAPMDVTLRVEAENWLAALKAGLQRMGTGQMAANILCDIQSDNSIHVTDPVSGRVFRIQEVGRGEEITEPGLPSPLKSSHTGSIRIPPEVLESLRSGEEKTWAGQDDPFGDEPTQVELNPSGMSANVYEIPRPTVMSPKAIGRPRTPVVADVLAELFERADGIQKFKRKDEGLDFLLDLAMEKIGAESGSVFSGGLAQAELRFSAARGPKADEVMKLDISIPIGVGIVGFCAQENVCLAISDAEKDPRFYKAVSKAIGYATKSILCSPITASGKVVGAMELINKLDGGAFDPSDVAVLSFLSSRAGELIARLDAPAK